jgi:hypothetical protein
MGATLQMPVETPPIGAEAILSQFHKALSDQIENQKNRILNGRFPGFPEYQRACGVYEGLLGARALFLDRLEEAEWEIRK